MRYGTPLSLLLLDVDHFKEYNDTFGHVAGDEVLRMLSQVLHVQGRETDFFARYGGEEFVVILPHTGSEGARTLAERLRAAVGAAAWPARLVTASIGAATLLPGHERPRTIWFPPPTAPSTRPKRRAATASSMRCRSTASPAPAFPPPPDCSARRRLPRIRLAIFPDRFYAARFALLTNRECLGL